MEEPPRCANIRGHGQTNKESSMNQYKTCRVCKVNKETSNFCKVSSSTDGFNSRCKACAKDYYDKNRDKILAQKSAYYQANYDRIAEYRQHYYAENRDRLNFQRRAEYSANPEKANARSREWARNNREKMNAYYRKYAVEKPHIIRKKRLKRRIRTSDNGVFEVTKRDIRSLLNRECVFCGSRSEITLDHVLPIARGGRHSVGNLMPLCLSCNASKQDKTFMEFRMAKIMQAKMKL